MWQCTHYHPPCPFLRVPPTKASIVLLRASTPLLAPVMSHCNAQKLRVFMPRVGAVIFTPQESGHVISRMKSGSSGKGGGALWRWGKWTTGPWSRVLTVRLQRLGWLLMFPHIQWEDAPGRGLPEWSEGSSRRGKFPLPFSIFKFFLNSLLLVPGGLFQGPWQHACLLTRCKWLVHTELAPSCVFVAEVGRSEGLWPPLRLQHARDTSSVRTLPQATSSQRFNLEMLKAPNT